MTLDTFLPILGTVIGTSFATWLTIELVQKKQKICWALIDSSPIISQEVLDCNSRIFTGDPISAFSGKTQITNATLIKIKIANTGNAHIDSFCISFNFGNNSKIHNITSGSRIKDFEKSITFSALTNETKVSFNHLNTKQVVNFGFLVSNCDLEELSVDMAKGGVHFCQVSSSAMYGKPIKIIEDILLFGRIPFPINLMLKYYIQHKKQRY